jgi:hypothetical protein
LTTRDVWSQIAGSAVRESPLWEDAALSEGERLEVAVFSPLSAPTYRLGLETIYEGYLVHYGRSRLFAPAGREVAVVLGDYLYAQGLVHIAETGDVTAVADLAELISLCSQARANGSDGDGVAWAATAAQLGRGTLDQARRGLRDRQDSSALDAVARAAAGDAAVEEAIAAHARLVG